MKDLFWVTMSCVKGVGSKTLIQLYENYPDLNFDNLSKYILTMPKKNLIKLLSPENINSAKHKAENLISAHEAENITVIDISSKFYPKLLRLIPDPPTLLFAKGNLDLLLIKNNVAIVGTREPTPTGIKAAKKIAATFAKMDYTIVSGLAVGIDSASHKGALSIKKGKTIAVLAGDLTKIYPAKNKDLAQNILNNDGLWLSETPIGQTNMRGNFVKRDRIQSGLSLGICPVQTPLESGTQHTIEFSKKQDRFLFTPVPLKLDLNENAIQGNIELIKNGTTVLKNKDSYEIISNNLDEYKIILEKAHIKRFEKQQEQLKSKKFDNQQLNLFN